MNIEDLPVLKKAYHAGELPQMAWGPQWEPVPSFLFCVLLLLAERIRELSPQPPLRLLRRLPRAELRLQHATHRRELLVLRLELRALCP